jgi:ABC-type transport system substrate-binding protein
MSRYCDPAYDALVAELSKTASLEERAEIAKKMNDMVVEAGAIIPLTNYEHRTTRGAYEYDDRPPVRRATRGRPTVSRGFQDRLNDMGWPGQ